MLFTGMYRAILEFLFVVLIIMVLRALVGGVMKGLGRGVSEAFGINQPQNARRSAAGPTHGGDLHRDPICGTFVAQSTPFRTQTDQQTFYFCSDACRQQHKVAAR